MSGGMSLPSLDQVSALLRQRRSLKPVGMDSHRPIERELLTTLLTNATWAPTHGLTEPWRFKVFQGESRDRLAAAMHRIYRDTTPPQEFREDKLLKMSEQPLLAPTIVVWSMHRNPGKIPASEEFAAVACAMQNLMLSATAAGLGSFWSSPPLIETEDFKQWLGIRAEDRCLGLLYLGWPKEGAPLPQSARRGLEEIVTWA